MVARPPLWGLSGELFQRYVGKVLTSERTDLIPLYVFSRQRGSRWVRQWQPERLLLNLRLGFQVKRAALCLIAAGLAIAYKFIQAFIAITGEVSPGSNGCA